MVYTFKWTINTWANRASATYVSVDQSYDSKMCDLYGNTWSTQDTARPGYPRRPAKMQETSTADYITYSNSTGDVVIYKTEKNA